MTKAEDYLDHLYNSWQVWQKKLETLPADYDLLYRKYSSLAKAASSRYYAAKYMMKLMKEDTKND